MLFKKYKGHTMKRWKVYLQTDSVLEAYLLIYIKLYSDSTDIQPC